MSVRSYRTTRCHTVPGKRMNSRAMLQIANHRDGQPIYSANLFSDCENVQQRLGGMFTNAISCIDQRLATIVCCPLKHKRCCIVQRLFQTTQYETTAVTICTTCFNTIKLYILPTQHTCMFHMIFTVKSNNFLNSIIQLVFLMKTASVRCVPWLRGLVTGLSTQRPGFDPRSVHMRFVVDKVELEQVFLPILWFSPVSIIPSSS